MSTATLTGARWSSAVRCVAKAQHQALGTPPEDNPPPWLDSAFSRGFHVGEAWALIQQSVLEKVGHDVQREMPIEWGLGWTGHADLADLTSKTIYEAYHSKTGEFRPEKALQAAGYADMLGEDWNAVLVAIDATDVDADGGFAVRTYPVNVDGLREHVRSIRGRVIAAVQDGAVNPADRVGDTPYHSECRSCPFAATCHANWTPPTPDEVVGMETHFDRLRIVDGDLKSVRKQEAVLKRQRDELLEEVATVVEPGQTVACGGTTVKRIHVAGGLSFSLSDATKAGYSLPDELAAFVREKKAYDKWEVTSA